MTSWIAWNLVVWVWSFIFLIIAAQIRSTVWTFLFFWIMTAAAVSMLAWGSAFFLQEVNAWPFIPQ